MARKNGKNGIRMGVPSHTKSSLAAILLIVVGVFLTLAPFGVAGIAGSDVYRLFDSLVGVGYFLLPVLLFVLAGNTLREDKTAFTLLRAVVSAVFVLAGLGFVEMATGRGGLVGRALAGPAVHYFDTYVAALLLGGLCLAALLVLLEGKISLEPFAAMWRALVWAVRAILRLFLKKNDGEVIITGAELEENEYEETDETEQEDGEENYVPAPREIGLSSAQISAKRAADMLKSLLGTYTPPPLSLLERDKGRPGVGDIKANANLIKRTLQNFGITVELDEISIGPSVTRYAIKPAEGVRLGKIISLQTNLELALAAHPVRIEAPIPGKSLVGIEVPNSAKVTVGLGTLLESPEFAQSPKPLLVALGRDIAGGSHFGNIGKMPHILIAGATGSGKSVAIHCLITSLLYRLGPSQLRFIMIDPKRVELTMYNKIPHLLTPVITDAKRSITALRWAAKEMERRYNILEGSHVRDIDSYHQNILAPNLEKLRAKGGAAEGEKIPEAMPYILIIIDELADIMQAYPRELEAAVVRLAQMSRAIGIHLVLSTQRPSVNVITGLIKANIPSRVALQVASQFDSRTILDDGGAEDLLGAGDMLYLSGDNRKPVRLQSPFVGEGEVKKVVDFIANNNEVEIPVDMFPASNGSQTSLGSLTSHGLDNDEDVDDDMYEAARASVMEAGKASTSYLQRKLRIGYARAARIIDMLEERGVIGPGDGAKPREIIGRPTINTTSTISESEEEI